MQVSEIISTIDEGDVIASAVRKDEIPLQYRKLPFLGRGATTLAFEKDADNVILFTRDRIKIDWLAHGLHMADNWEEINPVRFHHIRGMGDMPLYMVVMPKLFPLSPQNRAKVVRDIKEFTKTVREYDLYNRNTSKIQRSGGGWVKPNKEHYSTRLSAAASYYAETHPDSKIGPFLTWLLDYSPSQYILDLGSRQFKQTADGDIVLLDPIVDKELVDLFVAHRQRKYNNPRY